MKISFYLLKINTSCITVPCVFLCSAQEGSGPEIVGPAELVVTDSVGNALIGFNSSSLAATIDEGITTTTRLTN